MFGIHNGARLKRTEDRVGMLWAGLCDDVQGTFIFYCISIIACIFGAICLAVCNLQFVTVNEKWLWRISAVVITFVPLFFSHIYRYL
jgi:hypothetical protein